MKARFRVLAALVALFAFSASFAEGVWASACMGMGSMEATRMGMMGSMPSMEASHADQMAASAAANAGEHARMSAEKVSETPLCPLSAVVGSCVVVSLPSSEPATGFGSAIESAALRVPAPTPDLLLATALLHPPRA